MVEEGKDTNQYNTAIILIFSAVLISALAIFVPARMLWNENKKIANEVGERKEVKKKLEVKLKNLEGLKDREEELKAKNEKVIEAIPKDTDIPRLFVQLENIGNLSGLYVEKTTEQTPIGIITQSSPGPANEIISPVSYEYQAKSDSYISVKSAIQRFENALRMLSIKEIEIDSMNGMAIKIRVETYKRSTD